MNQYRFVQVSHPVTGKRISLNEHVYIWLLANGLWQKGNTETPDGCVIHHKDFNPRNNDIANLECLTYSDHNQLHWNRDAERRKAAGKTSRKTWAKKSKEERRRQMESARAAALSKLRKEGPTPAQLEGLKKARAAAYGGTRIYAKQLSAEQIAEIKRVYPTIKKKHGAVKALAASYGIERRRLCRIALT